MRPILSQRFGRACTRRPGVRCALGKQFPTGPAAEDGPGGGASRARPGLGEEISFAAGTTRAGLTCRAAPRRVLRLSSGRRRALWPWLIPPLSTFLSYWPRPWLRAPGGAGSSPSRIPFPRISVAEGLAAWLGEAGPGLVHLPKPRGVAERPRRHGSRGAPVPRGLSVRRAFGPPEITAAVHDHGALVLLQDLAPAPGDALALEAWGVDFAVGCGYKFLNGGPGAPATPTWRRRIRRPSPSPWRGGLATPGPSPLSPATTPLAGVDRLKCGTPPILSLAALAGALKLFEGVSPAALREKSLALTSAFMEEVAAAPPSRIFITPWDPERRGSQVAFVHPKAYDSFRRCRTTG